MGPLKLALREMRRRAGRFAILIGAISVLVFFLLFQQGLLAGLVTQFVGALRNTDAQVLVYSDLARDNIQASVVTAETVDEVAAVDGVRAAGPLGVGTFTAEVAAADPDEQRTDVVLFGYQLDRPGGPASVQEGRLPTGPGEAVTSSDAGEGFAIGDTVRLTGAGTEAGPAIAIVGTADDLSFSVLPTLYVDLATFTDARLAQNPDATAVPPSAVAVLTEAGADPAAVAASITADVDGTKALTRDQAAEEAPGVSAVQQSFSIILLLGWITVGAVIGFFFLILTTQKVPQLTLFRALGVSTGELSLTVLVQIAVVVTLALLLGGFGATRALAGGGSGISAGLSTGQLVSSAVVLAVLSLIALAVSARRIRGLDPVDAVNQGAEL